MKKFPGNWRTVLMLVAVLNLSACASTGGTRWVELEPEVPASSPLLHITGTVHHRQIEGGLYVIRDAEGTNYQPMNLPAAFRVDGLAVEAIAQRRDDRMSIGMTGPIVALVKIRKRPTRAAAPVRLSGTAWRLEDLVGTGMVDGSQATLVFSGEGRVSGHASCNRFHGSVAVNGDTLAFSALATTRKMCVEALMRQEQRYMQALEKAQRFEIKGPFLYVYATGLSQPLRFTRMDASRDRP